MHLRRTLSVSAGILSLTIAATAFAQAEAPATAPQGGARVNEINERLQNQQTRTDAGVSQGTINSAQAARNDARNAKVQQQLEAYQAEHNGHITKREQRHLNRELDRSSHTIHQQRQAPSRDKSPASTDEAPAAQ